MRISAEKAWTVIFAPDLIEYAFLRVSFQRLNLWAEGIQINHAPRFTSICTRQITAIYAII